MSAMRLLAAGTLAALLAACGSGSATQPELSAVGDQPAARRAELGRPIELKVGESVDVTGAGLRLTFRAVENESRCPADAVCVWAGDAEIALKIEQGTRAAVASLHTTLQPQSVEFDGYDIALVSLAPYPYSGKAIEPGEYRATVRVTKR